MDLWNQWWLYFQELRPAFKRTRTFLWFAVCVIGLTVRNDLAGTTSIVRALGLKIGCYERLLGCFHSHGIQLDLLYVLWVKLVLYCCEAFLFRVNGRLVLLGDGIKVPKSGKKMPGVKRLHQESDSNTKPEFIFGHSCQAIGLVIGRASTLFSIPLICQIHEGLVFSNRDKQTLITKIISMLISLQIKEPCYFVLDAYYSNKVTIDKILEEGKDHLISRVRSNGVAYYPPNPEAYKGRGRKPTYGEKVRLKTLFDSEDMTVAPSPLQGESGIDIRYLSQDLLWKPLGILVRFVVVRHPAKGKIILMSTDIQLDPLEIIRLYSVRFKIEVAFKQAVHTLGAYTYRFWMKKMKPLPRRSGNQYLHRESEQYRDSVRRKLYAYHVHIMAGIIAQGLTQILAISCTELVWSSFGSWLRTIRPDVLPSEQVVCSSLYYAFSDFLKVSSSNHILAKFIRDRMDDMRVEAKRLVA